MQPLQLRAHIVAPLGIELGQWLVEQQDLGVADQCTAKRHALLFAARQGVGLAVEPVRQPQHLRSLLHASFDLGGWRLLLAQRIGEIIVDGEVRIEREGLEHHRHAAVPDRRSCHVGAAEHEPAFVRHFETCNRPQRRGLANRAWTEDDKKTAFLDIECEPVKRADGAVTFGQILRADGNRHQASSLRT